MMIWIHSIGWFNPQWGKNYWTMYGVDDHKYCVKMKGMEGGSFTEQSVLLNTGNEKLNWMEGSTNAYYVKLEC